MKTLLIGLLALGSFSLFASESVCTQVLLNQKGETVVYSQTKFNLKKCVEWGNQQVKSNLQGSSFASLVIQHPELNGSQIKIIIEDISVDTNH